MCGNVYCRIFATDREAFAAVLAGNPAVLGVGEAHARSGVRKAFEPAVRDDSRGSLLPLPSPVAQPIIVVELLVPNPDCEPAAKAAAKEQGVVTDRPIPRRPERLRRARRWRARSASVRTPSYQPATTSPGSAMPAPTPSP